MTQPAGDGTGGQNGGQEGQPGTQNEKTFTQAEVDALITARLGRERAKFSDYADLKKFRDGAMSENEKAVAAAREEGAKKARSEMAGSLVTASISAVAKGAGIADGAISGILAVLDTSRFINDDGTVNHKLIESTIASLAPKERTSFEGGPRKTSSAPASMSDMIRRAAGYMD